jgi:arylsulfatase A-like enzyme/Tfp pilus assembly protein PilF
MSSKRSKKKRRNIRNDSTKKSACQPVKTQQIQRESEESKLAFRRKVTLSFVVFVGIAALAVLFYLALAKGFFGNKKELSSEISKMIAPLKPSDLNVLFFTLDTTRSDHIGCYGYPSINTSNIDYVANEGILFQNATSQSPLTLPSHSSIFTGIYPPFHGVKDNGGFYLEEDKVTLAEILQTKGWVTGAFVGAFVLDSRWGLDQGFDHYYDNFDFAKYKKISLASVQREGGEVIKAFFEWFDTNSNERFFSWIHFYDPHTPYKPPEPFKSQYENQPFGIYDGEIAYVDFLIGKVLDSLREKKLLDKTIIVIVGDHGESLGEHKESTHGFFIYDATISVPMIIRLPSASLKGKTIASQVQNVDIMPTLCEILDLPIPENVQGQSLLPLITGRKIKKERLAYSETYYPRYHYGWSDLKSLRTSKYKYILAPRPELYDLDLDPREQENIYEQNRPLAKKFAQELKALEEKMAQEGIEDKGPQKLDEEAREKLMALGYIGGFTSDSKLKQTGNLADPKDKIILFNRIKMAEGASSNREYDEALKLLDQVISEDPGIMEARQVRANIFLQLECVEETIEECKEALKIDPEYSAAIFTLAQAYKKQKKYDEAIAGFDRIVQIDSRDPKPHVNLGAIYTEIKEYDNAIAHLEQAIVIDPEHNAMAHNLLGSVYLEQKMLEPAEEEFRVALKMRPRIPDAHYNLGVLYEEKGDLKEAMEEYKKEIEIHPNAYPAHFNLALLYRKMGLLRDQIRGLREAIDSNKNFSRAYLFLAKAYCDLNENYDEAISLAKKGLELDPEADSAPLGHYVLADIYNRLGRHKDYSSELQKGKLLEKKINRSKNN